MLYSTLKAESLDSLEAKTASKLLLQLLSK